jgi:Tol biopolymer transport system component
MTSPSHTSRRRYGALAAALTGLLAPVLVATPASASATANELVYVSDHDNDGLYDVVLRDFATRRVTTVLPSGGATETTADDYVYDEPELSPDGTRIALSTTRGSTGGDEGIAVVNRDGTGFRRLTFPPQTDTSYTLDVSASWSPDASRLLFTRITVTQTDTGETVDTALLTVPVAGGDATALVGGEDGYTADWSPDGRRIVFAALPAATAEEPRPDSGPLTIVNADGSGGRTVLDGATGLMPAWSPDGSTIAYATVTSRDPDRARGEDVAQIALVPAGGGTPRVLDKTRPGSERTVAEYPTWLPDGQSLVYDVFGYSSTDAFPPGELWAIDKDGVRAGKVTNTTGDEAQAHAQGPQPASVTGGQASTYVPVTPSRILDTREGLGAAAGKIGEKGTVDLQVTGTLRTGDGRSVTVPSSASAVVLNVTVTGTTAPTDVRAYPTGAAVVGASNLNADRNATVPNLVTVAVGSNGRVTLRNAAGSVHLIADLAGYYMPDSTGVGFSALEPGRVLDTRIGHGAAQAKLGAGDTIDVKVTGTIPTADRRTLTVPADARAVVLNVTATNATQATDIRAYPTPTDGGFPRVSNLNVAARETAPNLVTVAVGEGGQVRLRNAAGSVDLIADLAGYYAPGATGRFVPVVPTRFLDTRVGVGGAPIPVTPQGFVDVTLAGFRGVPPEATAVVLNLTATGVTAATDVRAYPTGTDTVPTVSNLNVVRGATRANLAIVKTGTRGAVRVRNAAGEVQLIGDLAGFMVG